MAVWARVLDTISRGKRKRERIQVEILKTSVHALAEGKMRDLERRLPHQDEKVDDSEDHEKRLHYLECQIERLTGK